MHVCVRVSDCLYAHTSASVYVIMRDFVCVQMCVFPVAGIKRM